MINYGKLFKLCFIIVFLSIAYVLIKSSFNEIELNNKKSKTFNSYQIITINKDTIKGNFTLEEENGSFLSSGEKYYLNIKDSTKYYVKNIISTKPIKLKNNK